MALLTLFFYVFSPNIIAHGRLATLDFGVTAFIFVATYFFIEWLKKRKLRLAILSGALLGLSITAKFSALILLPILLIIFLYKLFLDQEKARIRIKEYLRGLLFLTFSCFVIIWVVYGFAGYRTPPTFVEKKISENVPGHGLGSTFVRDSLQTLNDSSFTRPLAIFGTGVAQSLNYNQGPINNYPQYLFGKWSAFGWWYYYLAAYSIKETLSFLIFLLFGAGIFIFRLVHKEKIYFTEKASLITLFGITLFLMIGNLNIGLRYFLPALPFIYLLVAKNSLYIFEKAKKAKSFLKIAIPMIMASLLVWIICENVFIFPSYLAYFNELIVGPKNGYKYLIDSNLDWGQDLGRLNSYLEKNNIENIYLDKFGSADDSHYFKKVVVSPWHAGNGLPTDGYLAISANFFEVSQHYMDEGINKDSYQVLEKQKPIAVIGYSIYLYKMP